MSGYIRDGFGRFDGIPDAVPRHVDGDRRDPADCPGFPFDLVFEPCHPVGTAGQHLDVRGTVVGDGHAVDQSEFADADALVTAGDRPQRLGQFVVDALPVDATARRSRSGRRRA